MIVLAVDGLDEAAVMGSVGFISLLLGMLVGVSRWLATPERRETANSPQSVLRRDRVALLIAAGSGGIIMAGASVLIAWDSEDGFPGFAFAFSAGGYIGTVGVVFCSGSVWIPYVIARLWLAVRGRLPWRMTPFLRGAHAAGVLRQTGSAYQLRHNLLREYLADRYSSHRRAAERSPDRVRSASRRCRLIFRVSGALSSAVMLGAVLTFLYPEGTVHGVFRLGQVGITILSLWVGTITFWSH